MDRFGRGLVAGIIGAIVMNIWSFFSFYVLKFTNIRFLDWSSIMIFGNKPQNFYEFFIALIAHIAFNGFLGILLALIIKYFTSRELIIKGIFTGFIFGFFIYAIPVLFKTPQLQYTSTGTASSNLIGGVIWGITTALVLRFLDSTPRIKN